MPGIVGFQDLWVAGSRFYFQRDTAGSTTYPLLDLGTVNTISPNQTAVTLFAPEGINATATTWELEAANNLNKTAP